MTVLLDATAIPANRGGVGRYVENLVPELVKLGTALVVVCQLRDRDAFESAGVQQVVTMPPWGSRARGRFVWEQLRLPALARAVGATVIHSPHYTFPLFTRRARVVTIHDLTFFSDPELHSRLKGVFFRTWIRLAHALRLTVVTPSIATADEFRRVTGAKQSLVVAAQLGYDTAVFHQPSDDELAEFRASLHPAPGEWVAFLGTLEPRKNVPALVRAFVSTTATMTDDRPALLLAGGAGWDTSVADAIAQAQAAGCDVRTLGYLPIDHLRSLLGGSVVTAYPSLGEGFGLPVLEAMASGAAVLTTRRLSLPEVGGDAVAYCDVDEASIAGSLTALLSNPTERHRLAEAGLARATRFSWHACATAHLRAYSAALGNGVTRNPSTGAEAE
ncbi:glycosyltransferase family 4 protein [Subtercola sp. PAMC28395]|nr:glycosyltransferase family 4 protein [Subtercola sp. PAMC28395]